jgi:uncharacterized membrane protein (UPF0127 family)
LISRFPVILALSVTAIGSSSLVGCKPAQSTVATTQQSSSSSSTTGSPSRLPTTRMSVGNETFELEIAYRPEDQETGLMHRRSMPADHGMIFVFPDERNLTFWMKDTLIPLDIIYVNHSGTIVSVKPLKPLDKTGVSSDGPAMYAIELNAGAAARAGVKAGDVLSVPADLRVP